MSHAQRILVVDDSDHVRILVSKYLKQRGFSELEMAANGNIALEKAKVFHPKIIFLDAIMPEMGGLAVLRQVKKEYPDVIVVIMSSLSAFDEIQEFKTAGADFYLLKPFEPGKFNEVADKAIALAQTRKEG